MTECPECLKIINSILEANAKNDSELVDELIEFLCKHESKCNICRQIFIDMCRKDEEEEDNDGAFQFCRELMKLIDAIDADKSNIFSIKEIQEIFSQHTRSCKKCLLISALEEQSFTDAIYAEEFFEQKNSLVDLVLELEKIFGAIQFIEEKSKIPEFLSELTEKFTLIRAIKSNDLYNRIGMSRAILKKLKKARDLNKFFRRIVVRCIQWAKIKKINAPLVLLSNQEKMIKESLAEFIEELSRVIKELKEAVIYFEAKSN